MADADPPNKVDDGESPRHRNHHAEESDADGEERGDAKQQHEHERERHTEADPPEPRSALRKDDGADLVGERVEGMTRRDDLRVTCRRVRWMYRFGHAATP